jgi:type I restriction enzyme S subunit
MTWPTVAVGEIAQQVRGVSYDKSQVSNAAAPGLKPVLRAGNIQEGRLLLDTDLAYVPDSCIAQQQLLIPGDIVIAASSGSIDVVGKAAQLDQQWEGSFGAFCKVVRPTSDRLEPRYLHHFFQSSGYRRKISSLAAGASINNLKNEHIDDLEIPLPPLEEQRRIAAILDKAQSLKDLCDVRRSSLRSFEESLFRNLFGDRIEQSTNWQRAQFANLCSRLTVGVVVRPASYYCEAGVPALRSLNVKPGNILKENLVYVSSVDNDTALAKSKLSSGDLIFVRTGRPGTCAVIPPDLDGCNAIDLLLATVDATLILPEFACSFFNSSIGKAGILSESRGQIQQHFNAGSLAEAMVPVPPLQLQQEYCEILETYRNRMKLCDSSVAELGRLSCSIASGLLSGN